VPAKKKAPAKGSAAQFRMAEEASKKKQVRTDARGRQGMGASKAKKPGMSTTEKLSWVVAPELMALGTVLSKAETAARKKIFGSKYAGDPQTKKAYPLPKKIEQLPKKKKK